MAELKNPKDLKGFCVCSKCNRRHRTPEYSELCANCNKPCYDHYKVKDEVWAASGLETYGGILHPQCLEQLINRPLTIGDFTDAPINYLIHFGYRLAKEEGRC